MVTQRYLVDSNVLSEMRKGQKADTGVQEWAGNVSKSNLFTSVICMMEIKLGVLKAMRKDPDFGAVLLDWYENRLKPSMSGRILSVDQTVAETCAILQMQRSLPFRDSLIAANAKTQALTLVTRNTKDFMNLGVDVLNPWNEGC